MKLASLFALVALPVLAQTPGTPPPDTTTPAAPAPPPNAASMADQVTSVLTPAERDQLTSVRLKAMAANPDLQSEQLELMQKGMALQSGSATEADKAAFGAEARQFGEKVRAAMVKIDPTVEPILEKIEAQVEKLRSQSGQ